MVELVQALVQEEEQNPYVFDLLLQVLHWLDAAETNVPNLLPYFQLRLATVLDQLSDGVVLFDTNGEPELVNAAAEALLGISRGASGPADWDQAFRSRALQKKAGGAEDFFPARALRGERLRDVRFTVRVHGSDRYIAASAAPVLGQDGVVRGAAVVLHDVTDEHEYAEMLRHTNQELRQQAAIPGFRVGHAPRKLIEKRYTGLTPHTPGMFGYSILRLNQNHPFVNALFGEQRG